MQTYAIFSPFLDQSVYLSRLLAVHKPGSPRIGVLMPGETGRVSRTLFDRVINYSDLLHVCKEDVIVVPTGSASIRYLLESGDIQLGEVTMGRRMLAFFDKTWAINQASTARVPVPQTWRAADSIGEYPVFYKPAVEGRDKRRGIAWELSEIPLHKDGELIFQEYIRSKGTYGVAFIAKDGKMLSHYEHFELMSFPSSGGSAVVIEPAHDERLARHTRSIIGQTNYNGWGLAEYKFCKKRDDFVFMEVNAKFWASCEMAFLSENAFPRMLFGVDTVPLRVRRMIFLGRALSNGMPLFLVALSCFRRGAIMRLYPGWHLRLAASVLPGAFRRRMRRFLSQSLAGS